MYTPQFDPALAKEFIEIHIALTAAALEAVDKSLLLCYYVLLVSLDWKNDSRNFQSTFTFTRLVIGANLPLLTTAVNM